MTVAKYTNRLLAILVTVLHKTAFYTDEGALLGTAWI